MKPNADLAIVEVAFRHAQSHGAERERLGAILGLVPEPCKEWENPWDGYLYCSTHDVMWHKRKAKPPGRCFADYAEYPAPLSSETPADE